MSGTDPAVPLSVTTDDLTLTVDGVQMPVRSTGDRIFVEAPSVRAAVRVARGLPRGADATAPGRFLTATDLTTEFRVHGRTVIVVGSDARPGALARRLGVAPAEVRLAGIIGAGGGGALATLRAVRDLLR